MWVAVTAYLAWWGTAAAGAVTGRTAAPSENAAARIAIVAPADDALSEAIAAELRALGFAISWRPPADVLPLNPSALVDAARVEGAIVAIRARVAADRIELWIADRVTSKTVLRVLETQGESLNLNLLALHTVELLRASLLEATLPDAPPGEVPITPAIEERANVPPRGGSRDAAPSASRHRGPGAPTLYLSLVPTATWSPGGLSPGGAIDIAAGWMATEQFGVLVFASVSVFGTDVERKAGHASLERAFMGTALRVQPWGEEYRWVPSFDLGLAAVLVWSHAETDGWLEVRQARVWTAAPTAQIGLAFRVADYLRLRATLGTGLLVSPVSLRFVGEEVATWGLPFASAGLGLDVGWFRENEEREKK